MGSEHIEQQAALWVLKRHDEGWTSAQQSELDAWLAESTAHRIHYIRQETALREVDRLRAFRTGRPDNTVPASVAPASPARRWKGWLATAAGLGILLIGSTYWLVQHLGGGDRYVTGIGDLQMVTLADGSQVTLNTSTQIRVLLRSKERRIDLESGEAFFTVAKDSSRPFVIHVADKQVTALATAFSVRHSSDADIQVIVTEGQVQLRPTSNSTEHLTLLNAGSAASTLNGQVFVSTVSETDTEKLLSWRNGFVIFHDTPLADAVAEFNRYNRRKLIIADPSINSIRISGKFRCRNVEVFLALLQQGFPVTVKESDQGTLLERRQ